VAPLLRALNRANPTAFGRGRVVQLARELRAVPDAGVHSLAPGLKLQLEPDDTTERDIYFDAFEFLTRRMLRHLLRPGTVFVDVGANIGYYTVLAGHWIGEQGIVWAFEPNPTIATRLRQNVELNGLKNVTVREVALGSSSGTAMLHCPKSETHGYASLAPMAGMECRTVEIQLAVLDLIAGSSLARLDVIKMDIEGFEDGAVAGARETILRYKPHVLLEVNAAAAHAAGHRPLDAVRRTVSCYPRHRLLLITDHAVQRVSVDRLERDEERLSCNVLVSPE